jgi:DNA polymerase III psi subunit
MIYKDNRKTNSNKPIGILKLSGISITITANEKIMLIIDSNAKYSTTSLLLKNLTLI